MGEGEERERGWWKLKLSLEGIQDCFCCEAEQGSQLATRSRHKPNRVHGSKPPHESLANPRDFPSTLLHHSPMFLPLSSIGQNRLKSPYRVAIEDGALIVSNKALK
jgi:hypothetical protein